MTKKAQILEIVRQHPGLTTDEVAMVAGATGREAIKSETILDVLKDDGLVVHHMGKWHHAGATHLKHFEGVETLHDDQGMDKAGKADSPERVMRAKMAIHHIAAYKDNDGNVVSELLRLSCVGKSEAYPEDGSDEDNTFAKFTPSGDLTMNVANPALLGLFNEGDAFYVDFIPVNFEVDSDDEGEQQLEVKPDVDDGVDKATQAAIDATVEHKSEPSDNEIHQ